MQGDLWRFGSVKLAKVTRGTGWTITIKSPQNNNLVAKTTCVTVSGAVTPVSFYAPMGWPAASATRRSRTRTRRRVSRERRGRRDATTQRDDPTRRLSDSNGGVRDHRTTKRRRDSDSRSERAPTRISVGATRPHRERTVHEGHRATTQFKRTCRINKHRKSPPASDHGPRLHDTVTPVDRRPVERGVDRGRRREACHHCSQREAGGRVDKIADGVKVGDDDGRRMHTRLRRVAVVEHDVDVVRAGERIRVIVGPGGEAERCDFRNAAIIDCCGPRCRIAQFTTAVGALFVHASGTTLARIHGMAEPSVRVNTGVGFTSIVGPTCAVAWVTVLAPVLIRWMVTVTSDEPAAR